MSKNAVTEVKPTSNALAIMEDMEADAGTGFENVTTKDISIPYLSLAQATSPKVKKGPAKVEGLEEGDFINTATMEIFKAGEFRVIPCGFKKTWIEKDGATHDSNLVAVHDSEEIEKAAQKDPENGKLMLSNGHCLIPTAMHYVFVVKADGSFQPAVISLSGSQLRRSKDWFAVMTGLKVKTASGLKTPAPFSHSYLVTSVSKSNDQGSWMLWTFSAPEMLANPDIYRLAKAFHEEVKKGTVKVAEPVAEDAAPSAETAHF